MSIRHELHEQYEYCRENLVTVVENPKDSEYDAIFYYIGQYDYDPQNEEAVDLVVNIALSIATESKQCKYTAEIPISFDGLLYKCPEQSHLAPETVKSRIAKREQAVMKSNQNGIGYVPEPDRFKRYVEYAYVAKSDEELSGIINKKVDRSVMGYDPSTGWNPATIILLVFLIVVVFGVLLSRVVY